MVASLIALVLSTYVPAGFETGSTVAGLMEFFRSGAFGAMVAATAAIYSARKAYSGVQQNLRHTREKDATAEQWARFERILRWVDADDAQQSAAAMTMLTEMIDEGEPLPTGMVSMIASLIGTFDDETALTESGDLIPTVSAHRRTRALVTNASRVADMAARTRPMWHLAPGPPPEGHWLPHRADEPGDGSDDESVAHVLLSAMPTHINQLADTEDAEEAETVDTGSAATPPEPVEPQPAIPAAPEKSAAGPVAPRRTTPPAPREHSAHTAARRPEHPRRVADGTPQDAEASPSSPSNEGEPP